MHRSIEQATQALPCVDRVRLVALLEDQVKHRAVAPDNAPDILADRRMADDFAGNIAAGQKLAETVGQHEAQLVTVVLLHGGRQIDHERGFRLPLVQGLFDQLHFHRPTKRIHDDPLQIDRPAAALLHNLPTHGGLCRPCFLGIAIPNLLCLDVLSCTPRILGFDRVRNLGVRHKLIGPRHVVCNNFRRRPVITKIGAHHILVARCRLLALFYRLLFGNSLVLAFRPSGRRANFVGQRLITEPNLLGLLLKKREKRRHHFVQFDIRFARILLAKAVAIKLFEERGKLSPVGVKAAKQP